MDYSTNTTTSTSTVEALVAKTIDNVINSSPATLKFLGNQKIWKGTKMKFPVKYQKGVAGMSFDGLDKFSTSKSDSFINMEFSPTGYETNVAVAGMEVDVNATAKKIDIIARELQSRQADMIDDIAGLFYTVHSSADKKFLSLYDACDDETLGMSTYGGVDRSTYGNVGTYTATGGAMSLTTLRTKFSACTHGAEKPDLIVTSQTNWNRYEALVSAASTSGQIVYTNQGYPQMTRSGIAPGVQALKGQRGFDVLWFSGCPVVVDAKIDTNYLLMLNTNHLAFYGLKSTQPGYKQVKFGKGSIEGVYSDVPKTPGFSFSGFNTPIDAYGQIGHIILLGNLIADSPRHLGIEISYTS